MRLRHGFADRESRLRYGWLFAALRAENLSIERAADLFASLRARWRDGCPVDLGGRALGREDIDVFLLLFRYVRRFRRRTIGDRV
jgi:hypothetical protein